MRFRVLPLYLFVFVFAFISVKNYAQNDTIYVAQQPLKINLKKKATVYSSLKKERIELINVSSFHKVNDGRSFFYFGFNKTTSAFKIHLKNLESVDKTVYLRLSNTMINEIEGYKLGNNIPKRFYVNGIKYPFSTRIEEDRNYVIPIKLTAKESATYIINFHKKEGRPLVTSARLFDEKSFKEISLDEYLIVGVYLGLAFICLVVGFGLFFFYKKSLFLFYSLYVLFLTLFILSYSGVTQQFFLDENIILNKYLHYAIFGDCALLLFVVFSQKFLQTKRKQPKLYQVIVWILTLAIIIRLSLHFFFDGVFQEYIPLIMKLWYTLNTVGIFIVAYQIVTLYKKEKKKYLLFSIAYLLMVIGTFISIIYHSYGLLNGMFLNLTVLLYTSFLELIILIVAIGFLVKEIIDDKKDLQIKLEEQKKQNLIDFIELNNKNKIYISTLKFVKSDGNYLEFYSEKEKVLDRNQLKKVLEKLPSNFVKVHRSYIINKNYVKSVSSTSIIIFPDIEIPLSRTFKSNLKG